RAGRIARVSLEPLWVDRARSDAGGYQGAAHQYRTRASHQRPGQGRTAHRTLHDRAILRTREAMASVTGDDKARRRLAVQVATPRALEDLATLSGISDNRDLLNEPGAPIAQPLAQVRARGDRFGEALVGIGDRAEGAERGGHRQRRRLSPRLYF